MVNLLTSGISLIRKMAPDHEGRWSDVRISRALHLADLAICESTDFLYASSEIELTDGDMEYAAPADAIDICTVEYSRDGITYDSLLIPANLQDLDRMSYTWEIDTGIGPDYYVMISSPGTPTYSKILLWRPISTTSGEKIRINYTACRPSSSDLTDVTVPRDLITRVYVPYAMFILLADGDIRLASEYLDEYAANIGYVRARYNHLGQEREEVLNDYR